jgi:hypothetical protein
MEVLGEEKEGGGRFCLRSFSAASPVPHGILCEEPLLGPCPECLISSVP